MGELVVGCWLLVVGCWLLGGRCWVVGVGCWVLGGGWWVLGGGWWVVGGGWRRLERREERTATAERRGTLGEVEPSKMFACLRWGLCL